MRVARLLSVWNRLRSTYWFVPSLFTTGAIAAALGAVEVDARFGDITATFPLLYAGGPDGGRALLSAVAGSMITVVSVTFSVTVVALTVSAQHFGPRLLNSFMRDAAAQLVLGTFIGTFAYCVVVLRTVRGSGDGYTIFVPHAAVTGAVALTLVSVAMLIFYVHHVAASLQVAEIANGVAKEFEAAVTRLYPQGMGDAADDGDVPPVSPQARAMRSPASGYVQDVDPERLLERAVREDVVVWVTARPGDFVVAGSTLAMVAAARPLQNEAALRGAWIIGHDRTAERDAGFAVQQLAEVALHALSPGINEPFTAMTCIDRLGQGLACLASRALPAAARADDAGRLRVIAAPRTFPDLLEAAFGTLRPYAAPHGIVVGRLLATLAMLAQRAARPQDRSAIRAEVEATYSLAIRHAPDALDREQLRTLRGRALDALDAAAR